MQQSLQPDSFLQGGKYHIIKTLGQGGFGITYLAEHTQLEVKVALKEFFMKDYCLRDESTSHVSIATEHGRDQVDHFRQKFLKEARNIAKLDHPNIVRISDVFEENGTAYYVMKYCEGGSLSQLMRRHPDGLDEAVAVRYIRQVASALDYIHRLRMMHLDIKPGNIMLDANDNAIVIDFGLSKQYDAMTGDATTSSAQAYTEGYAPMEQYMKGGVSQFSPSTDIYALAATLYKLLTGLTPPNASIVDEEGLPDYEASPSVKRAIGAAMQRRKLRPQSISEWLAILDAPASEATAHQQEADEETVHPDSVKQAAEQERKAREEVERKAKAEAARKAREEAEHKKKASSASQSSEPASKKPWLWGIAAVVALALVWLVWPKPYPPIVEPDLIAATADSIKDAAEQLAVDTKVELEKKEEVKKEEPKKEEPAKTVEPKKEEPKKEEPKKEAPITFRSGTHNGHDYVDLGLKDSKGRTIYWATCNVGASKPEDYGLYFAWGETKGYTGNTNDGREFDWTSYKWMKEGCSDKENITKYTIDDKHTECDWYSEGKFVGDNKTTLSPSDDAAHVNWGGNWRMPTRAELDQLRTKCKWMWDKTRKGYTVKGPNGNSLFLPAAGCRDDASLSYAGSDGLYWSSSLGASNSAYACYLLFVSGNVYSPYSNRYYGRSVRAVCVPSE